VVDDVNDIWGMQELFSCSLVCDTFGFDLVHVHVENRVDALVVVENSQLFLHFACHCPGMAAQEGGIDGDGDEHAKLCAELDVRAVEESSEGADFCCPFLDPPSDFQFVLEAA
jgi:hypothetical protein